MVTADTDPQIATRLLAVEDHVAVHEHRLDGNDTRLDDHAVRLHVIEHQLFGKSFWGGVVGAATPVAIGVSYLLLKNLGVL